MNDEFYERFLKNNEKMNDNVSAMTTYLKRHTLLMDKIIETYNLSPETLEELGEFLTDWGKCLTRFGELRTEECNFLLEMLEKMDDD